MSAVPFAPQRWSLATLKDFCQCNSSLYAFAFGRNKFRTVFEIDDSSTSRIYLFTDLTHKTKMEQMLKLSTAFLKRANNEKNVEIRTNIYCENHDRTN